MYCINYLTYIVTELVEGSDMTKFIQSVGVCEIDTFYNLAMGLMNGLAYIHSLKIAHKDIKTGNIMIREKDYTPVIIDLGLACDTEKCNFSGSPNYMSPELADNKLDFQTSMASDVWAMGIVFYKMMHGFRAVPFSNEGADVKTALKIIRNAPYKKYNIPYIHGALDDFYLERLLYTRMLVKIETRWSSDVILSSLVKSATINSKNIPRIIIPEMEFEFEIE